MRFDVAVAKFEWGQSRKKDALATHSDFGKTQKKMEDVFVVVFKGTTGNNTVDNDDVACVREKCTELSKKNIQYLIIIKRLYYKCFSGVRVKTLLTAIILGSSARWRDLFPNVFPC